MHPAVPPLPELDRIRTDQVADPALGAPRVRVAQLVSEVVVESVELLPLDPPALGRDRRRDAAIARAALEVGVRVLWGETFDRAPDPHLPVELAPVDDQRG